MYKVESNKLKLYLIPNLINYIIDNIVIENIFFAHLALRIQKFYIQI